jgi:hypothetical protein
MALGPTKRILEDSQHPYFHRDIKPAHPASAFSDIVKVRVGTGGDVFHIHPAFFRGLDHLLDELLNNVNASANELYLPTMAPETFAEFAESGYFRNDIETQAPDLLLAVEAPVPANESEPSTNDSPTTGEPPALAYTASIPSEPASALWASVS